MEPFKQVKITNNHLIPKSYRKGYLFFIRRNYFVPECIGAEWVSKNKYVNIYPVSLKIIEEQLSYSQIVCDTKSFNIKQNYVYVITAGRSIKLKIH